MRRHNWLPFELFAISAPGRKGQRSYAELAEGYGFKIDACPPHDPQKNGIIESGVKYIKKSFLPLRTFRDLAEAKRIGAACHAVVLALFNDQVLVNLRGSQGILQLEAKVGAVRLETASPDNSTKPEISTSDRDQFWFSVTEKGGTNSQ